MPKKRHYRRRDNAPPELDVTTFLNLMVVLVPFLLITAVFSRITIHELSMPASAGPGQTDKPEVTIEVIVRKEALEVGDGRRTVARFRNDEEGEYALKKLSDYLLQVKQSYPDKTDATILMESDIEYDYLVQVMDTVRVAVVKEDKNTGSKNTQTSDSLNTPTDSDMAPPSESEADKQENDLDKIILFPDISIGDAP